MPCCRAASGVWHGSFKLLSAGGCDLSLVSYRHGVGYRRSPGNLAALVTRSIDWSRMSLWSLVVVGPPVADDCGRAGPVHFLVSREYRGLPWMRVLTGIPGF
jgi:hypothetical protein